MQFGLRARGALRKQRWLRGQPLARTSGRQTHVHGEHSMVTPFFLNRNILCPSGKVKPEPAGAEQPQANDDAALGQRSTDANRGLECAGRWKRLGGYGAGLQTDSLRTRERGASLGVGWLSLSMAQASPTASGAGPTPVVTKPV